jgi:hypothetical protein
LHSFRGLTGSSNRRDHRKHRVRLGCRHWFKIYLVVTSNIPGFAVSHIELELPWQQTYFYWLEDPRVIDGPSRCYRFFGNQSLEFERDLVLNHRLKVTQPFSAGESAEGFLLGLGFEPIPEVFTQGKMILAFVVIYDQFARKCRVPVKLWADRSTRNIRSKRSGARRKRGLFDKCDRITQRISYIFGG